MRTWPHIKSDAIMVEVDPTPFSCTHNGGQLDSWVHVVACNLSSRLQGRCACFCSGDVCTAAAGQTQPASSADDSEDRRRHSRQALVKRQAVQATHCIRRSDFNMQRRILLRQALHDVRGREDGSSHKLCCQVHARDQVVAHHWLRAASRLSQAVWLMLCLHAGVSKMTAPRTAEYFVIP